MSRICYGLPNAPGLFVQAGKGVEAATLTELNPANQNSSSISRLAQSSAVHAVSAFGIMGGWAFFANHEHGVWEATQAALVQGVLSGTITVTLKKSLDWLSARFWGILKLTAPPLVACTVAFCVLLTVHYLAGTPEILATIAVPFSSALLYGSGYSFALWRMAQKMESAVNKNGKSHAEVAPSSR